jgi:hypothetical protein
MQPAVVIRRFVLVRQKEKGRDRRAPNLDVAALFQVGERR